MNRPMNRLMAPQPLLVTSSIRFLVGSRLFRCAESRFDRIHQKEQLVSAIACAYLACDGFLCYIVRRVRVCEVDGRLRVENAHQSPARYVANRLISDDLANLNKASLSIGVFIGCLCSYVSSFSLWISPSTPFVRFTSEYWDAESKCEERRSTRVVCTGYCNRILCLLLGHLHRLVHTTGSTDRWSF